MLRQQLLRRRPSLLAQMKKQRGIEPQPLGIERKAWRSTFQDGLWDIYLGMILFTMGISALLDTISVGKVILYTIYCGFSD